MPTHFETLHQLQLTRDRLSYAHPAGADFRDQLLRELLVARGLL
jgi:hypothetical protein